MLTYRTWGRLRPAFAVVALGYKVLLAQLDLGRQRLSERASQIGRGAPPGTS